MGFTILLPRNDTLEITLNMVSWMSLFEWFLPVTVGFHLQINHNLVTSQYEIDSLFDDVSPLDFESVRYNTELEVLLTNPLLGSNRVHSHLFMEHSWVRIFCKMMKNHGYIWNNDRPSFMLPISDWITYFGIKSGKHLLDAMIKDVCFKTRLFGTAATLQDINYRVEIPWEPSLNYLYPQGKRVRFNRALVTLVCCADAVSKHVIPAEILHIIFEYSFEMLQIGESKDIVSNKRIKTL